MLIHGERYFLIIFPVKTSRFTPNPGTGPAPNKKHLHFVSVSV
jgi:hypothetical protein